MRNQITSHRWMISYFALVLIILMILSGIAYIIDPFFQFRLHDSYELCAYTSCGLIKNYDYDTLIIGSSMTQNFNMDEVRKKLDAQPLHIGLGGISRAEVQDLLKSAYKAQKAKTFFVGTDQYLFTEDDQQRHIPKYLLRDDPISRCRYLLGHEVWFHYLPLDVGILLLNRVGVGVPIELNTSSSAGIDKFQSWGDDAAFGEDVVLGNYKSGQYSVSEVDTNGLYDKMTANMDDFLAGLDYSAGEHIFFFPPYSSLFWCGAQDSGYFDAYAEAKLYFIEQATKYGATVYDFQSAEFTMDLDNYKDTTHYRPEINDWMVECFASGEYRVTAQNYQVFKDKLTGNTNAFREAHLDLFE